MELHQQSSTCSLDDLFEEFKHYLFSVRHPSDQALLTQPGRTRRRATFAIIRRSAPSRKPRCSPPFSVRYLLDLAAGGEPENREVVCKPLWQPSSVEKAETLSKVAPALVQLVDYAIISGEAAQDILRGLGFEPGDIDPAINTPSLNE